MVISSSKENHETEFVYRDIDHFFRKRHFISHGEKERSVIAKFHDEARLNAAVKALQDNDFRNDDIFLTKVQRGNVLDTSLKIASIAPTVVPLAIIAGMVIGSIIGLLAQLGGFSFLGITPFMDSTALNSMAAHGSVGAFIGGVLGTFYGMRWPEYERWRSETTEPDGTVFLLVRTENAAEVDIARKALEPFLEPRTGIRVKDELAA